MNLSIFVYLVIVTRGCVKLSDTPSVKNIRAFRAESQFGSREHMLPGPKKFRKKIKAKFVCILSHIQVPPTNLKAKSLNILA